MRPNCGKIKAADGSPIPPSHVCLHGSHASSAYRSRFVPVPFPVRSAAVRHADGSGASGSCGNPGIDFYCPTDDSTWFLPNFDEISERTTNFTIDISLVLWYTIGRMGEVCMPLDPYVKGMFARGEWVLDKKRSKAKKTIELTCKVCGEKFVYDNRRGITFGPKLCSTACRRVWKDYNELKVTSKKPR